MTFSDWIAEELKARDISQRQLARSAGIAQGHLSNVLTGKRALTADLAIQIAAALDLSPVVVLTKAGIIPPQPDSDPHLQEITELIRQLSPEMQKDILDYVRFRYRQEKGQ